jgi:CDP-diacylglycerol--serine O-phosphatidyltransferase
VRGIHLLPNVFTAANLSLGFASATLAVTDGPESLTMAAWMIIGAWVMDACDGRVARWTRSVSEFGTEFDSLADLVSFGVAPALLLLRASLTAFGAAGFAAALAFVLAAALRLARFNVQARSPGQSSYFFTGCPIPAAAVLVASLFVHDQRLAPPLDARIYLGVTITLAVLMVSYVPYPSMKKPRERNSSLAVTLSILALVALALFTYRESMILALASLYVASGPFWKVTRALVGPAHRLREALTWRGSGRL